MSVGVFPPANVLQSFFDAIALQTIDVFAWGWRVEKGGGQKNKLLKCAHERKDKSLCRLVQRFNTRHSPRTAHQIRSGYEQFRSGVLSARRCCGGEEKGRKAAKTKVKATT